MTANNNDAPCPDCNASGRQADRKRCARCNGRGRISAHTPEQARALRKVRWSLLRDVLGAPGVTPIEQREAGAILERLDESIAATPHEQGDDCLPCMAEAVFMHMPQRAVLMTLIYFAHGGTVPEARARFCAMHEQELGEVLSLASETPRPKPRPRRT